MKYHFYNYFNIITRYLLLQTITGRIPVYSGIAGYIQENKWVQFLWLYLFCENLSFKKI